MAQATLWLRALGVIAVLAAPGLLHASKGESEIRNLAVSCILAEEARHGFPFGLLLAIAKTESSLNWRASNRNTNGTTDIGIMQINSMHLPRLARKGVGIEQLWHPCINASVGAMILREFVDRHGMTWKAVAAYNTGNPLVRPTAAGRYVERVRANHERIMLEKRRLAAAAGGGS